MNETNFTIKKWKMSNTILRWIRWIRMDCIFKKLIQISSIFDAKKKSQCLSIWLLSAISRHCPNRVFGSRMLKFWHLSEKYAWLGQSLSPKSIEEIGLRPMKNSQISKVSSSWQNILLLHEWTFLENRLLVIFRERLCSQKLAIYNSFRTVFVVPSDRRQ